MDPSVIYWLIYGLLIDPRIYLQNDQRIDQLIDAHVV